ncbi:MAG: hypothetical protein ACRDCB_07245 [Clostridium sp.]|uniref:hypothetical protein n=1 Tax=Clostridium TaxID=1485 RepID=UPI002152D82E|nr:hypothetical protein [Clostridium sp. LY3-2]MCR6515502.1 hypothetical protein [Clostridium sp. LY3-2]
MYTDVNLDKIPLVTPTGNVVFSSITNDSNIFYLLEELKIENCSKVYKYDDNFNYISETLLCYRYNNLYFNNSECIFYGTIKGDNLNIYKLDIYYELIGTIKLNPNTKYFGEILGISFNCCYDTIVVTYRNFILDYNKSGEVVNIISTRTSKFIYCLEIAPLRCIIEKRQSDQIFIISSDCGCINININERENPRSQTYSLSFKNKKIKFFTLFNDGNKSYVRRFAICLSDLPLCPYMCNLGDNSVCKDRYPACTCVVCKNDNTPCNNKCNLKNDDIEKSIANIENSISKILNSESLKIQKVLDEVCSVDDILMVNDSVLRTIKAIKELEEVLVKKLKVNRCDDYFDL